MTNNQNQGGQDQTKRDQQQGGGNNPGQQNQTDKNREQQGGRDSQDQQGKDGETGDPSHRRQCKPHAGPGHGQKQPADTEQPRQMRPAPLPRNRPSRPPQGLRQLKPRRRTLVAGLPGWIGGCAVQSTLRVIETASYHGGSNEASAAGQ